MPKVSEPLGVISDSEIYTLAEAKRRLNWSDTSFRTARRNGLKIRYVGRVAFLHGADFRDYLDQAGRTTK